MNTHNVLRLAHIVGGILWVGFAVFVAAFLIPALRRTGPAGAAVMGEIAGTQRLPLWMMAFSWITLLSGGVLAWRDAGPLGFRWFETNPGLVFGIGMLLGIAGALVGLLVSAPTTRRLGALGAQLQGAGRPPSPEEQALVQRLQGRLFAASRWVAVLLIGASAAMATARYAG